MLNICLNLQQNIKWLNEIGCLDKVGYAGRTAVGYQLTLGTIHLRRWQIFTIFDPYPLRRHFVYYYTLKTPLFHSRDDLQLL